MELLNRVGMLLTIAEKLQGHPTLRGIRSHVNRELATINKELEEQDAKIMEEERKKAAEEEAKKAAAAKEAA